MITLKKKLLRLALLFLAATAVLLGVTFIFPTSRYAVVGFLKNEPSVGGRYLSYWRWALRDPDYDVRRSTARALGRLGPEAAPTAPDLIAALKDNEGIIVTVGRDAATALVQIGEPALPALRQALQSDDRDLREGAAFVLREMGRVAAPAVPELSGALDDPDDAVRRNAASALGHIGPGAEKAVPALAAALKNRKGDDQVMQAVAGALGAIGANAEEAVPALIGALNNDNPRNDSLSREAAEALGRFGSKAQAAVPALKEAARGKDEFVRKAAAEALTKIQAEP